MAKTGKRRTAGTGGSDEPPDPPATRDSDEPQGERLGIQIGADGRIEWDRLRANTRDKLRVMLTDPRVASELGANPVKLSVAPEAAVDGATIGMLYGALGSLMVGAATAMGYTPDSAAGLQFTAEEREALLTPTSRVLSKYTGALGEWEDEIMLAFAIGSIVTSKVTALKKPAKVIKMASAPTPTPAEPLDTTE